MNANIIRCYIVEAAIAALYLQIFCGNTLMGDTNLIAEISAPLSRWKNTEELISASAIVLEHTQWIGRRIWESNKLNHQVLSQIIN